MAFTAELFFRPTPACRIDKSIPLGSTWVQDDMKVVVEGTERSKRIGSFGCNLARY